MQPFSWIKFADLWQSNAVLSEHEKRLVEELAEEQVVRYQTELALWTPQAGITAGTGMLEVFAITGGVIVAAWALTPRGGTPGGGGLYFFAHQ
jgi:hypothetical protein